MMLTVIPGAPGLMVGALRISCVMLSALSLGISWASTAASMMAFTVGVQASVSGSERLLG